MEAILLYCSKYSIFFIACVTCNTLSFLKKCFDSVAEKSIFVSSVTISPFFKSVVFEILDNVLSENNVHTFFQNNWLPVIEFIFNLPYNIFISFDLTY